MARKSRSKPPPDSLRRLAPHQRPAFAYARRARHPALLMEMRLGKTLVAIRTIKLYKPRRARGLRVLIVAPGTVLGAWEQELALEGERNVTYLVGARKGRLAMLAAWDATWYLTNKEAHLSIGDALAAAPWDAVVLDEHFIKNPKARVTKFFINNFRDVPHRFWLTGTPAPEGELDLVCPLLWLDGRAFGAKSYWTFRARNYTQYMYNWMAKAGVRERMLRYLGKRAFLMRRHDVKMDQPKIYQRRIFTLPPVLRKAYNTLEDEFILEINGKERARTKWRMTQFIWLRRLCGGFVVDDNQEPALAWPDKINELIWLMQGELKGQQVVVWASFNSELQVCAEALELAGVPCKMLTGATPVHDRKTTLAGFAARDCQVLLCQTELAKYGINLSTASTAVYYSGPLGTETRQQSEDRVVRAGRKQAALIIDFVVKDSVDEDVYNLLVFKKEASVSVTHLARVITERRKRDGT